MQTYSTGPDFKDYQPFVWRDLCVVALTIVLWVLNAQTPLTAWPAVACGILTGICAMQLHEWGHIWGAFRSGADIYPPRHWWHPFMFSLDHKRNNRDQFIAVSWPAFLATGVYVLSFALFLPLDVLAGRVALIMASVTAGLTLLIEVPLFIRVYRGGTLPRLEMFARPEQGRTQ